MPECGVVNPGIPAAAYRVIKRLGDGVNPNP